MNKIYPQCAECFWFDRKCESCMNKGFCSKCSKFRPKVSPCPSCYGSGIEKGRGEKVCPACGGSGIDLT